MAEGSHKMHKVEDGKGCRSALYCTIALTDVRSSRLMTVEGLGGCCRIGMARGVG